MDTRTQEILRAVVDEYIKQAEPISSGFLVEHLNFDVSPATMRGELSQLEEMGLLEKPHTSGGRIPTPRGYRFFVDNLLGDRELETSEKEELSRVRTLFELHEFLARKAGGVIIGGEDTEHAEEVGLLDVLDSPEFIEHDMLLDFMRRAEMVRKEFSRMLRFAENEPHVYIGEEAKDIVGDDRYSILFMKVRGDNAAICFGLTRMNYGQALAMARYLSKT